jgi:hypothetical protein
LAQSLTIEKKLLQEGISSRGVAQFCSMRLFEEFSVVGERKLSRIYSSFLIRYWRFRNEPQAERWYFDVEHIQSGQRRRVNSLAEAQRWMEDTTQPEPHDKATEIATEEEN